MDELKQFKNDINETQNKIQKAITELNDKYGNCLVFNIDITDISTLTKTNCLVSLEVTINQNYIKQKN